MTSIFSTVSYHTQMIQSNLCSPRWTGGTLPRSKADCEILRDVTHYKYESCYSQMMWREDTVETSSTPGPLKAIWLQEPTSDITRIQKALQALGIFEFYAVHGKQMRYETIYIPTTAYDAQVASKVKCSSAPAVSIDSLANEVALKTSLSIEEWSKGKRDGFIPGTWLKRFHEASQKQWVTPSREDLVIFLANHLKLI